MLKHLYKTLLVSVICGSLLTLQSPVAFAASETKGTVTTDSNGVITAKKNYTFDKVSDSDMLASITMLAGGYIAGRMWQAYTPVSTDVTIAAAGGVAFIAGEIMSNVKFKGTIDAMTLEVEKKSDGTVNEEQVQRLQDLKKSYEEAKKTTKMKKTLQLAAAAAFGAAALTAAYMSTTEEGKIAACQMALNGAETPLKACIAAGTAAAASGVAVKEAAACTACQGKILAYRTQLATYSTTRRPPGEPSIVLDKKTDLMEKSLVNPAGICLPLSGKTAGIISKSIEGTCYPTVAILKLNQQSDKAGLKITKNDPDINRYLGLPRAPVYQPVKTNLFANYLERSLSLFFPEAKASWLPLLGLGAGTALAFTGILGTMGVSVDTYMYVPMNRAIAFGVLAGIAFMASKSSDNVIKKIDENIKRIDAILADLTKLAKGVKGQNLQNQSISIQTVNPGTQTINPYSTDSTTKSPCMTGNSSENCTALEDKLTSMPGFSNLPDSLKGIASQAVSLGDSLSGSTGVSGSALASAESLAAKQNAISKALKNQQAVLSKITKGKYDPNKEADKFMKKATDGIRKELGKHGMTATGFMASIGGTPIDSSSGKEDQNDGKMKGNVFEQGAVNLAAGAGEGEKEKEEGLKLEFKDQSVAGEGLSMGTPAVSGAEQYDVKTDEINKQNGPSIFELISRRYIKSGYPKLLEEEPSNN